MNWSTNDIETQPGDTDEPVMDASTNTLYLGDCGELSLDTRRAFVQLLAGPAIDGHHHSKLWLILIHNEAVIRRRLSELFLELVIDRDAQVAFTRQADTGELEVPTLLRRAPLTFLDSVLVLHLRQQLTQADTEGKRAVISSQEIIEHLTLYERAENTDKAGFIKRIYAALEKTKKYNVLRKIRGSEDRFEISPTLKLLFSAEEIQALTALYQRKATGELPEKNTSVDAGDI